MNTRALLSFRIRSNLSQAAYIFFGLIVILIVPPKGVSKKPPTPSAPDNSWLFEFCRAKEIPEDVLDVLAQNHITSKSMSAAISEHDLANMSFVVGQEILLRLVIFRLQQDNEDPLPTKLIPSEASGLFPAIDLQQKVSNIESAFSISSPSKDNDVRKTPAASPSVTTESNSSPEGKLANIKILVSLFSKNPCEADEYLGYLKFLAIKGTRFQTKAILAFDQDLSATKARDNYSWFSNPDDLSP